MKIIINEWLPDDGISMSVEIHSDGSIVPIGFSPEYDETLEALSGSPTQRTGRFLFIADDPLRAVIAENIIRVGPDISKYMLECVEHSTKVMSKHFPKNDAYIQMLCELTTKAKDANGEYPKDTILHHTIIKPFYNGLQHNVLFNETYTPTQRHVFVEIVWVLVLAISYDQTSCGWLRIHDGSITNALLRLCLVDQPRFDLKNISHNELLETPERAWQLKHFFEFNKKSEWVLPS